MEPDTNAAMVDSVVIRIVALLVFFVTTWLIKQITRNIILKLAPEAGKTIY